MSEPMVVPARMQLRYERLDSILERAYTDNPKLHARDLIEHSIRTYGFRNPPMFDYGNQMLIAGHGRLEQLEGMMIQRASKLAVIEQLKNTPYTDPKNIAILLQDAALRIPENIVEDTDGMWLVPVIESNFATVEEAIRYLLMDNRSGAMSYRAEDYDASKMKRALANARGNLAQGTMPGFEDVEAGLLEQFQLPEGTSAYEQYDGTSVDGSAGIGTAIKESYVLLIACPTHEDLRTTLFYLSGGERASLRGTVKHAGMDCMQWLEKWKALAGDKLLPANATEAAEGEQAASETVVPATEPLWVGGLCATCGGSGNTGRRAGLTGSEPVQCVACDGSGDQDTWRKMHGGPGAPADPNARPTRKRKPAPAVQPMLEEQAAPEDMIPMSAAPEAAETATQIVWED